MAAFSPVLTPETHRPHRLHGADRIWGETNCYVDLWIEMLHARKLVPEAALGFTAALDFEGDQFTFFKFPSVDIERLYGLKVLELALYDSLEAHVIEQLRQGRVVLVEVDGYHLPDTQGLSYRVEHTKTTIGIASFDAVRRRMAYFHNAGFFAVAGPECNALLAGDTTGEARLFPYAEFVKDSGKALPAPALREAARELTRGHIAARPNDNPVRRFQQRVCSEGEALVARAPAFFHKYTFNTLRQLGASFELLAAHLAWLEVGNAAAIADCLALAEGAKTLQFQLARAFSRRRAQGLDVPLGPLADAYDRLFGELDTAFHA